MADTCGQVLLGSGLTVLSHPLMYIKVLVQVRPCLLRGMAVLASEHNMSADEKAFAVTCSQLILARSFRFCSQACLESSLTSNLFCAQAEFGAVEQCTVLLKHEIVL